MIPLSVLRSYSPHPDKLDLTGLTQQEITHGIKSSKLPDYIRYKQYLTDTNEALAQLAEMIIQFAVNLGLDPDQTLDWARKLQESVSQSEFDSWVATLLDGGPSIFVNTLSELQAKYPNGAAGVALVRETDPAKIYVWNGTAWEDFGDYQGIEVKNGTITPLKTTFIDTSGYATSYEKGRVTGAREVKGFTYSDSSRSVFYKIKPNTLYTVLKEKSDRFRILSTSDYPSPTSNFVRFIKDEYTTENEANDTSFDFVTESTEEYIIVTVSISGREPDIKLVEGYTTDSIHDIQFNDNITSKNIVKGKNLFDGKYVIGAVAGSVFDTSTNFYGDASMFPNARTIITPVDKNTDYIIYKTPSNRFRVAVSKGYPKYNQSISVLKDETVAGGDNATKFTLNTGDNSYILTTVCNVEVDIPDFVQIEKGTTVTELETYGYKFYPEAKPLSKDSASDVISVESFRSAPLTDSGVVQLAFDNANGKIVLFESGRTYKLDNGLTASTTNVRGILGNNAILEIDGTNKVALKVTGTKTTGNAMPTTVSDDLIKKEGNFFLEKLLVTSKNKFMNDGIVVEGLYKPILKELLIFRCKNGLTFKGMSRDVILDNLNIYDNAETGLLFDNVNIHQLNIHGGHISYNKNDIKFINGNVANVIFDGASAENSDTGGGYTESESIISFEETTGASAIFEVIIFSGCNIQDHGTNTKPLVNFDVSNGQIYDVIIGDTLLGNSGATSVPFYGKNIRTLSISNVNTAANAGPNSFVLEGNIRQARITNSNIVKPIKYDTANIDKMIIANNTTVGFTLEDSKTENILIQGNL